MQGMSERIELTDETFAKALEKATEALAHSGVIIYPTDTLYGLGADAFSDEAVEKVYAIKGRDESKPMHCIVADMVMAEQYAEFCDDARLLAKTFFPGPLTLVLKKKPHLDHGIGRNMHTIGIRIPDNDFCLSLASAFGRPFTATSANRAGELPLFSIDAILDQLRVAISDVALAIDAGELPKRSASTVVDFSGEEPVILREGAIAAADIWNAIRVEP
jgi:L-threonylcarbamoyladenylate synthase